MSWKDWRRSTKTTMPNGLWMQCKGCGKMIYRKVVREKLQVCPECQYHFTISSQERIDILLDPGSFVEYFGNLTAVDPLNFKAKRSYREKLDKARKTTGLTSAAVVGKGRIDNVPVAFGVTDARFIMGSMGSVVGEKLTLLIEMATRERLPLIIVSGSGGGARMEEGILSLMQMAKTSAALARHDEAGLLYIAILTNATMGGTMASFASLGDIIMAEPKALLGFAGPRVIQQTIKKELPKGFQRSEFLLQYGFLDMTVAREEMRAILSKILFYCGYNPVEPHSPAATQPAATANVQNDGASTIPAVSSSQESGNSADQEKTQEGE